MAIRMNILEEKVLNTIKENKLIENGDVIVVGVSGGPDSITLLSFLNKYKEKLKIKIIVAHINHLIRKDSTDDEHFVENVCKKYQIPFYSKRVKVEQIAKEQKRGTEETGRIIRYKFFDEIAQKEKANKIAIAHNMNDNAETMLLNIIRGTGMNGLEGIQVSEYSKYIRPLINCSREEIEKYCEENNLNPRIDSTNKENIYKRNIIRNELLPYIKTINPNIIGTLSRTSKIIKMNNDYIKNQAKAIYKLNATKSLGKISFDIEFFNNQDEAIKQNLVIYTVNELLGNSRNIAKINIDDIILLAKRKVGKKYIFPNKKLKILIENKKIFFIAL